MKGRSRRENRTEVLQFKHLISPPSSEPAGITEVCPPLFGVEAALLAFSVDDLAGFRSIGCNGDSAVFCRECTRETGADVDNL